MGTGMETGIEGGNGWNGETPATEQGQDGSEHEHRMETGRGEGGWDGEKPEIDQGKGDDKHEQRMETG